MALVRSKLREHSKKSPKDVLLQGDKGGMVNCFCGKSHSRECALPMKNSWLRHWYPAKDSSEEVMVGNNTVCDVYR